MNYLPHRHTHNSVVRFVPVLEGLIAQHKTLGATSIAFDPTLLGLSVNTAIARLHDAIHSIRMKLTSYPEVNSDDLTSIWPHYRITSNGVQVLIVPRVANERLPLYSSTGGFNHVRITLRTDELNFAETLSEFASLLSKRLLQGEVTIDGDLPSDLQETLEAKYDIAISSTGPNQHTML